jgi:hypothetical protein
MQNAVKSYYYLLHNAGEDFDSLLHDAARSKIYLLHNAAGRVSSTYFLFSAALNPKH